MQDDKWEYRFTQENDLNGPDGLAVEVTMLLNDGWKLHGVPINLDGLLVQCLVRYTEQQMEGKIHAAIK